MIIYFIYIIMNEFQSGALSGLTQNIVGHPFDTAKVYIQNNKPLKLLKPLHYYRGFIYPTIFSITSNGMVFSINKYIYDKTENNYLSGFITGLAIAPMCYGFDLFKVKKQIPGKISRKLYGFGSTAGRESVGFCFWLGTYFTLRDDYNYDAFFSGGIAGLLAWTFSYPIDVIKNRQMAMNIDFKTALQQGNLWRGYGLCATRAIVVNSVGFKTYDICN